MDTFKPTYRFRLKAKIIEGGYKSSAEFARTLGMAYESLSAVLNGWKIPSPHFQRKIADALGLSLKELKGLL